MHFSSLVIRANVYYTLQFLIHMAPWFWRPSLSLRNGLEFCYGGSEYVWQQLCHSEGWKSLIWSINADTALNTFPNLPSLHFVILRGCSYLFVVTFPMLRNGSEFCYAEYKYASPSCLILKVDEVWSINLIQTQTHFKTSLCVGWEWWNFSLHGSTVGLTTYSREL